MGDLGTGMQDKRGFRQVLGCAFVQYYTGLSE
jgi:hypothetical protein